MQHTDCDVVIVGAGPTGLMAAYLLQRCGVRFRIIDKALAPNRESRAAVMSARSLELFASLGLSETLLTKGIMTQQIDFHLSGRRKGGLNYDLCEINDTPFPFILMIPQSATEQTLLDALAAGGAEVERGVELVGLTPSQEGVDIEISQNGELSRLRAAYVLGADGGHSKVRHHLALPFTGAPYPQNFLLGDVQVNWENGHDHFRIFMHGERIGLFLPLAGSGLSRVMTTDIGAADNNLNGDGDNDTRYAGHDNHNVSAKERDDGEPAALELEELQRAFSSAAQVPVTLGNAQWLTKFRTHHRCVDHYRIGRIFVAGDAAHIHSPAGGQGMNTGLQDAANLAWKLAAVLQHDAPESLLETYESERLPVARDTIAFTDKLFSLAAGQSGWRARLRDALAPVVVGPASRLGFVQAKAFRKFAQLDIRYGENPFLAPPGSSDAPARPGIRAPNAQLSRHQDLFDVLAGYCFHVLVLSRRRLSPPQAAAVLKSLASLASETVKTALVARLTVGIHPGVETVTGKDVFVRYGLVNDTAQAVLLIRPDGVIAWRGDNDDLSPLIAFLQRFSAAEGSSSPSS
ncbi:Putative monooxygenase, FAD-binding protein (plasmid) [Sodalis praecaptivus]|uniref:Putative monooxygenase, FAD-binding protein n=1 Tax=Sodalis praecaptivus TaxID=1239307 RepID=W0I4E7_9GAMM|nr:FAD-dependent monooxygenase [Sodalis praecaptivus]AHF79335.1 Putative monooxygenase, FAD-binding protein [Sodalis praecaptivus]